MKIDCAHDSLVDVDKLLLIQNPKNNNKHSKEQIDRLAKIIDFQGQRHPIVVSNRSGFITKGHGRLMAIHKLGWKQAAVDYQDYISEAQEYADMTADNEIARWAEFDSEKFLNDIKDIDLGDIELLGLKEIPEILNEKEGLTDPDDVPEVAQNIHNVQLGQIWKLGEHRLMCGDSTKKEDVEILMNGNLADLWIADPPFGVSYMDKNAAVHGGIVKNQTGKEIKSDTKSVEELCPFWRDVALNAYSVTTMEASNYWCACQGSDKMMMMMMMMMDEAGWNIRHELIWVKDSFVFGRSDYHYRHEPIIYGWKKKGKHNFYGDRKNDSVIELPRPKRSDLHPTTKPVELFSKFILNSSKQNDLVFESFGGSGTTLIACEKLNRKSNSMELDPHYCSVIIERWQNFTGKKAELING